MVSQRDGETGVDEQLFILYQSVVSILQYQFLNLKMVLLIPVPRPGKHQHMSLLDRVWQVLGAADDQVG